MSNEYLRKSVADRRTGANLIGINVDTSNMRDLTPEFEMAFNQLEAFAKETDEIKINSEKKKIQLEIEKSRLEFKDKYLSDPSVYSSQEKWDEVTRLYEEERKNAKKRISESKYLSKDEKMLYSEDVDIDFKRSWLDPKMKRNGVVAQERIDEATMLFDIAVNNACLDDLYKTDTIDRFIKQVNEIYNPLINSAISTKGDKNKAMIKGVSTIEGARLSKKLESDILYNPMLSDEQKKAEINKAIEILKNPQRINEITESMSKEFGYDNYEKEYLKSSLKAQYENASIELDKKLYNLSVQNKTQKALEALQNKQNNKDNEIMKAIEDNDPFKMIKATTGKDLTTPEMMALENSSNMKNTYGLTMASFSDVNNSVCGQVISAVGTKKIKDGISALKGDGTVKISTQALVENVLNPYITENFRKYGDDIAMLKDIGTREDFKGLFNATVLIKGKENPLYYSTWDTLKEADTSKVQFVGGKFLGKGRQRFERLLNSKKYVNTPQSAEVLASYLSGLVEQSMDKKIQSTAKTDYNTAIYKILNDDGKMKYIENNILPILYNVKVSPINYQQAKLLPYERQVNKQSEVEEDDGENAIYGA